MHPQNRLIIDFAVNKKTLATRKLLLIFLFQKGRRGFGRVGEHNFYLCIFQCTFHIVAEQPELVLTRFEDEAEAVEWIEFFLKNWGEADTIQLLTQDPQEVKKIEDAAKSVHSKPKPEEEAKIAASTVDMNLPKSMFDESKPNMTDKNFKSLGSFTMVTGLLSTTADRQTFVVSIFWFFTPTL